MIRQARGFTLIEVLVAIAILAVSLAASVRAGGSAIRTAEDLRQRTLASWVAENRLAELRAHRIWPPIGEDSGELTMAGESLRWQQSVSATPNPTFRRIEINVTALGSGAANVRHIAYVTHP